MSDVTGVEDKQGRLGCLRSLGSFLGGALAVILLANVFGPGPVLIGMLALVTLIMLRAAWQLIQVYRGQGSYGPPAPPHGPQPCPRCQEALRGPSGWCWPCFGLLQRRPVTDGHPLWPMVVISDLSDASIERIVAAHTPTYKVWDRTGQSGEGTRQDLRRYLRAVRRTFPDHRSECEAAFVDPVDSAVAWTRTRDSGDRRFGGPPLDVRAVTRYRFEHGLAAELWLAPPLPVTVTPPTT